MDSYFCVYRLTIVSMIFPNNCCSAFLVDKASSKVLSPYTSATYSAVQMSPKDSICSINSYISDLVIMYLLYDLIYVL